jgi:hypothetical protein
MKTACYIFICAMSILTTSFLSVKEFPQAEITNGLIHARLYLPDFKKGYYRATRFDWSGIISDLEYNGHTYCGQWFEKYDPELHDAIMGPVEAFSPLGYDDTKSVGSFITIGVGVLYKPDESTYSPYHYYKILNPGKWKINRKQDKIEFVHTLNDSTYSYEYKKGIQLVKNKPELLLTHSLKNTGQQTIETNVYDHNFFLIDLQPTGPGFVISFPFNLTAENNAGEKNDIENIKDNQILFPRELVKKEQVYAVLKGYSDSTKDYDIKIENRKTGAGIRITGDQPISKLVFWASPTTVCPEPYIHMKINPGETFSWKITYEFYTCNRQH